MGRNTGAYPKSQTSRALINIMNWYLEVLKKYADFSGRARRKEFWMFTLFNFIFSVVTSIIDYLIGTDNIFGNYGLFSLIYALAILIPSLALSVRRLHDVGKSGYMIFLAFLPIIGWIWLFVLYVTDSQLGTNKWGPNPKAPTEEYIFPEK
jgi:uncharacterized membrane protein YhaH (DUF805 family)